MTRNHRTPTTTSGVLLTGALFLTGMVPVLAGCAIEAPAASAPVMTTPTEPATPEPAAEAPSPALGTGITPPARPAMPADTAEGAEAAIAYYLSLDAYMQATNDTAEWDAMTDPWCDYCATRSQQAHDLAAEGKKWVGGEITTTVHRTRDRDDLTGIWALDITLSQHPGKLLDADGNVIREISAGSTDVLAELLVQDGSWLVTGLHNADE